jgi:hypothetical protein
MSLKSLHSLSESLRMAMLMSPTVPFTSTLKSSVTELKMPKLRLRKNRVKSEIKWTSRCGRRRSRWSPHGNHNGETVVLVGTLNVSLWPPIFSVVIWISIREALI